jgi:hypothetical protein
MPLVPYTDMYGLLSAYKHTNDNFSVMIYSS